MLQPGESHWPWHWGALSCFLGIQCLEFLDMARLGKQKVKWEVKEIGQQGGQFPRC